MTTSRKALQDLRFYTSLSQGACPYSECNELCDLIEKDLKCGETCKKMLNIILQSFKVSIDRFKNSFKNEREFEMFKEWLENE